jgi:hypothetical protein
MYRRDYPRERRKSIRARNMMRDLWMLFLSSAILVLLIQLQDASNQAKRASVAAAQEAVSVQEQRIETISQTCEDQNNRLDNSLVATARALHLAMADDVVTPHLIAELDHSKAGPFVVILRALVPMQDCKQVVLDETGYDPTKPSTYPGGALP